MKIYESLKGKDVVHHYLQIKGNWAYFDIFPLYNCKARLIWKPIFLSALMALNPDGGILFHPQQENKFA